MEHRGALPEEIEGNLKTTLKHLVFAAFAFGTILQLHSQSFIVTNGVTTNLFSGEISVSQNSTATDYTGFFLERPDANTNSFQFNYVVDEGVRVFLVSLNDPISLQSILANNYVELTLGNNYTFLNAAPFYVGLYTGYSPWIITNGTSFYTGLCSDPVFGWAKLINGAGKIYLLDSALEYGGAGIVAGTRTIIQIVLSKPVLNLDGSVTIQGSAMSGSTNVIQFATNLVPSILWQNLATNIADPKGAWQFTDPSATNQPARFYRAITL